MTLVVIRLSAMGDVTLTLPALRAVLERYPDLHIRLVTRPAFLPLFAGIDRLQVLPAELKGRHRGLPGLYRLYRDILAQGRPAALVDLHDVLRSRVLGLFFRGSGLRVYRIRKGRAAKRRLTRRERKQRVPLKHTLERYLDTFTRAGYPASPAGPQAMGALPLGWLQERGLWPKAQPWVGIAPFARHREKRWPLAKMETVLQACLQRGCRVFLFGAAAEAEPLQAWVARYTGVCCVAGEASLQEELGLIGALDLMISMDSANMHLAAVSGIPVVSVWGATHIFAGFGPLYGNERYVAEVPVTELGCRPCSVFGQKPCYRGDHACMAWLDAERVLERVDAVLKELPAQGKTLAAG